MTSSRQSQADNQPQPQQTQPQQQERPKSDNPYVFSDDEQALWGDYSLDTCIARAWSRAYKQGYHIGRPLGEEVTIGDTRVTQDFQYASASFQRNDNVNQMVVFRDGRGEIVTESGL